MNTQPVAAIWTEWIGAASVLLASLREQEAALIARDSERVEELLPVIEDRRKVLEEVDKRARDAAHGISDQLGCLPSLSAICQRLSPADAAPLKAIAPRATELGDGIREAMIKNHALIENELAYVAATLTLIGQSLREPPTPYGKGAAEALTVDRKV